jgi:tetratricopeptide (TPR) repeat protein
MDVPGGAGNEVVFTQNINATSGGRVNAVQHGDQYNYIYRGVPPYRVEPFPLAEPDVPARLARVPSRLLTARYRVVPFLVRPELTRLESWRDDEEPGLSVRLVHAEGGAGKTRLAYEFVSRSADAGWAVALARHRSEVASAGGGDESLTVRPPGLVMVVDYAERWPLEDLITMVRQHRDAARDRLRILLLARSAGTWWQGLAHQFAKLDILDVNAIRLEALPDGPTVRAGMYTAARDRFAEIFAVANPAEIGLPDRLHDPAFALTLTVHMRALIDVDATARGLEPPSGNGQASLSSYLLDREHDHWRSSHDQGYGPVRTNEKAMGQTVYVATLTRSLTPADATAALVRAGVDDATTAGPQLVEDHARCYPPAEPGLMLDPLYPDRLGEDYLALTLPGHEDEFDYHATDTWAATAPGLLLVPGESGEPTTYTRQALSVLIETAHRWPHVTAQHLDPLLRQHPTLALAAGSAALSRLADLDSLDMAVLEAVEPHLPQHRHVDLDLGAAALSARLIPRRMTATSDPAAHAALSFTLAWRYGNAGLYEDALAPARHAVNLYRELAEDNPAAYLPELAGLLNNLGNLLSEVGRRKEALDTVNEAVSIRRRLAEADSAAGSPDLALALHNFSILLSGAGRREEALAPAEEAVAIRRPLAAADPAAYLPELAGSLANLGTRLSKVGRWEDALDPAREAAGLYRELAEASPAAFLPELAGALNNIGGLLSELGRREEALNLAEEAVRLYRVLVEANPVAYLPHLAAALNNLGSRLSSVGRGKEAVAPAEEAVAFRRQLAEANPAAELPDLAGALNNLGIRLWTVGRRQEALENTEEAVAIRRRLAEADPAGYLPDLAKSLNNLGSQLSGAGRQEEALKPAQEATDLYRQFVNVNPAAYLPNLAGALNNLGIRLSRVGRREEALECSAEAVAIRRRLAKANPAAYLSDLAGSLNNLGTRLSEAGRWEGALVVTEEAVAISRDLAHASPAAYLPDFASSLNNLCTLLSTLGRVEEARAAAREMADFQRVLAAADPARVVSSYVSPGGGPA